ncbi:glycosyltransferase N-terminal domain-containing protein [Thioalkalivibrio sp. AKL10]|uniref:glycosyltransferase N-terminal domain-containing protein n=1 Tax=Thioalkalivibrio sp. AKL10 TaxID=1158158 RepID=UPI0003707835|nr:glycosyltransferase N-terminal domain-containing protein [Thioalkalivibrio sp. AKL10]
MRGDAGGYGARRFAVWGATWRDYRRGEGNRARARRGFLTPPDERGRLVWIKAGGTPEEVRLGIELLGAVRDKRQDVRIVLTFEQDYPELFERHMQPFRKVGVGYGPCDRPRVVRRVLDRFQPHGILLAGGQAPVNLLQAAEVPVIAVNTEPPARAVPPVVRHWPVDPAGAQAWPEAAFEAALAPADPQARFVEAQADVVLRALVGGNVERLWWWHGTSEQWPAWRTAWQASGRGQSDILLASLRGDATEAGLPGADLAVSAWDRSTLAPGTILHLDDRRWFAAAASAAHAVHLAASDRQALWQGLAGGAAVSLGEAPAAALPCPVLGEPTAVLEAWQRLSADPAARRQQGDAARRRFWDERRQVDANFDAVLQQVWDW